MAQVKRGEFWLIKLDPSFGREIRKKRPALIISANAIHQKTPHVIVIPVSSQVPQIVGLEMVLVGEKEGLHKKSVLLPVFIRSIDQERLIKKIGIISKTKLREVETAVKLVLGLEGE